MVDPVVSFTNVHKMYASDQIGLSHLDLRIQYGEFVFVVGASGAGKSTFLKMVSCEEAATQGDVVILGRRVAALNSTGIAELRQEIGMVFQDFKLLPRKTISENIEFGLKVSGVAKSVRRKYAKSLLKEVGLYHKRDTFPHMLSGGEQQRVAVARAIITRPKILIADEPTASLDRHMATLVFDLLREAHRQGVTVIVATHNIDAIESLNFRTVVLDRGKLLGDFNQQNG
jgi:cell division transport system ATP-binding protein